MMVLPLINTASADILVIAPGHSWMTCHHVLLTVQRYTEALLLAPDWPVLLVNRAMCHKQRERWEEVESDSRRALELESRNMKVRMIGPVHVKSKL